MRNPSPHPETDMEIAGRAFARVFVVAGGIFWMAAAFAGPYVYGQMTLATSVKTAMWPFLAAVVTLIIGWTYERLAAVLLFAASTAVVVWGVLYQWEFGVWAIMTFVLIAPMAIAGVLLMLASRAEERRVAEAKLEPAVPALELRQRAQAPARPQ
ncbi:MAG: hypothetical protein HY876_04575 [Coriobacteriales bacterium]|nr:hypothetical protein [Coriobacteriales bacterium]